MNHSIKLSDRKIILLVIDLMIILVTTLFSLWVHARGIPSLTFNLPYIGERIGWLLLLSALWMFSASINGLYDPVGSKNLPETIMLLLRSGMMVLVVYLLIFFSTAPTILLPRGIVIYQIISGIFLISLWRLAYNAFFSNPRFVRKVIIIGAGWAGKTIAQAILENVSNQYKIIGFIDDNPELIGSGMQISPSEMKDEITAKDKDQEVIQTIPVIGVAQDLTRLVSQHNVPEVVLAITHDMSPATFKALLDLKEVAVDITLMTELYEELTGRIPIEHIGDNWFVSLPMDSAETSLFYAYASRLIDIISAILGLTLLLPFFPIISLVLFLDSPGPIFYSQERVGKGGKKFHLYKLRTMFPDAEMDGIAQRAQQDDPRITRVGRWLRKFRLDEMPQLINILKGEMSSVGPRPERPIHLVELDEKVPFHRLRNAVKPGMAGWAVVNFGYIDDLESAKLRLQYDLYYVKHQSLMLDIVILFRTFGQLFMLKGR